VRAFKAEYCGIGKARCWRNIGLVSSRGGAQTVPPLAARFRFKRQALDKDAVPATAKMEPLHFTAKLPPGAKKLGSVISACDLKAVETWKPEPGKAKAGDAFTRSNLVGLGRPTTSHDRFSGTRP
jgi:hypothetical protein